MASPMVQVFTVPRRVYAATDGVFPQWRFLVVALNLSSETLTLTRATQTRAHATRRVKSAATGDRIRGIIQGAREVPPDQVVVLEVQDSTATPPPPEAVELDLTFTRTGGPAFTLPHRVELEHRPTLALRFPLVGPWVVANGRPFRHCLGRQFGFDLLTPEDMRLNLRPPRRPIARHDCTSFGRPLLSPVRGRVVGCVDQHPDIVPTPGRMPSLARNNFLTLTTGSGEHVWLAHLRQGSLRVKEGERVEEGQPLAEVGNSGTTSQPHLHIEVLDRAPELDRIGTQDFTASGVPFGFRVGGALVVPRRLAVLTDE